MTLNMQFLGVVWRDTVPLTSTQVQKISLEKKKSSRSVLITTGSEGKT
jgi:hypothetical protein